MAQLFRIINAWRAYILGETSKLALRRASICKDCPLAKLGTYEQLMPDFQLKEVEGFKCTKCGCPLSTKLREKKEKCPVKKW